MLIWAAAWLLSAGAASLAAPFTGASADLAALPPAAWKVELERLADNGAAGLRLLLDWNRVEPKPNHFSWRADDAVVNAARARNLEVTLVLGPNAVWAVPPAWQVPPGERSRSIPRDLSLWERYVRKAAIHFKGRVRSWQVREHPNAVNFRGARSEYLRLLSSAARALRRIDPKALVVVPEAGTLDVAEIDRLCTSSLATFCDVFGVYLPILPEQQADAALAMALLRQEVPLAAGAARHQTWILGATGVISADAWMQYYLLAWAFGFDRVYLPTNTISRFWLKPLSGLRYLGYLSAGGDTWTLAFEDAAGPVLVAWATAPREIPAAELAPVLDPEAVRQARTLDGIPGSAVTEGDGGRRFRLGPRPVLIRGLDPRPALRRGSPTRADLLAARQGPALGDSPSVFADYSRAERPEFGLYNRGLRNRPGGRVVEEVRAGRLAVRTRLGAAPNAEDNPWIHFDIDDRWMHFCRGRIPVAITVECLGASGAERLGFNIMYDSTTGYRFTPWQWVEPGSGWQRYRVEINDASFADRNGYDFRINIKGSKEDVWVSSVTVERLDRAQARSSGKVRPQ